MIEGHTVCFFTLIMFLLFTVQSYFIKNTEHISFKISENYSLAVSEEILQICHEIEQHLDDNRCGERIRNGLRVAIVGEPNVGKSSLLNALCKFRRNFQLV